MSVVVEFQTIAQLFENLATLRAADPTPAIMSKKNGVYESRTFAELKRDAELCALGLTSLGIQTGHRVGLIAENRPEWLVSDMAMVSLGIVNVPMYTTLTPKQIEFILNDAGCSCVIVSNQFQLNKVLKILDNVPTTKKVIVMATESSVPDERVIQFKDLLLAGERALARSPGTIKSRSTVVKPSDLLTIIYTSGTTGNPKGVMLSHHNMVTNVRASADCIPFGPGDIILSYLPLCHSFERMAGYYTAMSCGVTIAYAESIDTLSENLLEVRPTIVTTVPRLFERIHNRIMKQLADAPTIRRTIFEWGIEAGKRYAAARKKGRPPLVLGIARRLFDTLVYRKITSRTGGRIKFFVSGGAALPKELGIFFEAVGIPIIEGYGMTEASPVISVNRVDNYRFGTVGQTIPGVEVRIAEDGEILVKGPNVMLGYWNNEKETREAIDADGWLHTGDIGCIDDSGFLSITDRKKHLFVTSGGKNIAPQPIENLIQQSHYVDQFILIGDRRMFCSALIVPDFDALREYARRNNLGNLSKDLLIKSPAIQKLIEDELDHLQKDLSTYERVRRFTLLDQPFTIENGEMTPSMKLRRRVIEEKFKPVIETMYAGHT